MDVMLQICGLAILSALLALVLKRDNAVLGTLLSVACCVMLGILVLQVLKPVVEFLRSLQQTASLNANLMQPLMKTLGIGILTQVAAAVCQDAGQSSMAKMVELCGSIVALYLSLPLLTAVLQLLNQMTGG